MSELFIPFIGKSFQIRRRIGKLKGMNKGPVLIFLGGVHGNEPSGMAALNDVFEAFAERNDFHGTAYAFMGNLKALMKGQRYLKKDLNRLWTEDQLKVVEERMNGDAQYSEEEQEQIELYKVIRNIMQEEEGPFMFFDLHTTSSHSEPFMLINDTMINRNLAKKYPLRVILGIEEYLSGPFLSYINDLGYVSLAFESGKHNDFASYEIHKKFILQTFLNTGFLRDSKLYKELIKEEADNHYAHSFFEVLHRYEIAPEETFKMREGYENFSKVKKKEAIADNQNGPIKVKESAYLFMPLYQTKGSEGFYLIKLIPKFWLQFSSFLRRINFDNLLLILPGVHRYDDKFKTLVVGDNVTRFISRDLFHLLGYRRVEKKEHKYIYIKREIINQSTINH